MLLVSLPVEVQHLPHLQRHNDDLMTKNAIALVSLVTYLLTPSLVSSAERLDDTKGYVTITQIGTVINNLISVVAAIGGMGAFLMLIFGGFRYITARGDPKALQGAQNTILWAVLGLVFIIIAYITLRFVGDFLGIRTTEVCIPSEGSACD